MYYVYVVMYMYSHVYRYKLIVDIFMKFKKYTIYIIHNTLDFIIYKINDKK